MEQYRGLAIGPYWTRIQAAVEADRTRRARALLDGGVEGLLASLRPAMRWDAGVLEVRDYPDRRELHLDGRGLLLVPSFFCARTPVALLDPALPPVLVYPVDRLGGLLGPRPGAGSPARGRRGAGRAARPDPGGGAGGQRRRLHHRRGRPPAAHLAGRRQPAHHRAAQRRAAGQPRDRNTVLHTLTPLGRAMLDG